MAHDSADAIALIAGVAPIDDGPELLRMPFGFHLAVDTLPSSASTAKASGALPPLLEIAPPIRAPVGLQPT